jgi:hypothetical protein
VQIRIVKLQLVQLVTMRRSSYGLWQIAANKHPEPGSTANRNDDCKAIEAFVERMPRSRRLT